MFIELLNKQLVASSTFTQGQLLKTSATLLFHIQHVLSLTAKFIQNCILPNHE